MDKTNPPRTLQEKDFIQENYWKNPYPFWLWLFLLSVFVVLFWGGITWYQNKIFTVVETSPFLQVTNRQMSIFLWQFPEHMRVNAKTKTGYLTGFQYSNKVSLVLDASDDWVNAPPWLLFLYHTWHRLLGSEFIARPIPKDEFIKFLGYSEEWKPMNWKEASLPYSRMVEQLVTSDVNDLQSLPEMILPLQVRQAFQGWKNYFLEGEAINTYFPTYGELHEFLTAHPNYSRNFWRNILMETVPEYLHSFSLHHYKNDEKVSINEMAPFLRVAIFNFSQAKLGN